MEWDSSSTSRSIIPNSLCFSPQVNRLSKVGFLHHQYRNIFLTESKYYERVKDGYLEYDAWIQGANGVDQFTAFQLDPEIRNYTPPPSPVYYRR